MRGLSYPGHHTGIICSGVGSPVCTRSRATITLIMCCGSGLCSGGFSYAQARLSSFLWSYKTFLCIIVLEALFQLQLRSVCSVKPSTTLVLFTKCSQFLHMNIQHMDHEEGVFVQHRLVLLTDLTHCDVGIVLIH